MGTRMPESGHGERGLPTSTFLSFSYLPTSYTVQLYLREKLSLLPTCRSFATHIYGFGVLMSSK